MRTIAALVFASTRFAQRPEFEVASVKPKKAPVDVLMIDHAERATAN